MKALKKYPLKERWLDTPVGYVLLMLLAIGVIAAFIALFQQIGASRKTTAVIQQIEQHEYGILDLRLTIQKPLIYQPGQYAFLKFAHDNEPHPFTIASSGDNPNRLRFAI